MTVLGCAGLAVGAFLTFAGLMAIETGGYGTPFFLLIYSAPFGLLPKGPVVLVSSIALWAILGTLAGGVNRPFIRAALLAVVLLHYVSIPLILLTSDELGGAANFKQAVNSAGVFLVLSVPLYFASQFYVWRLLLSHRSR
jgi:hypothetical protein